MGAQSLGRNLVEGLKAVTIEPFLFLIMFAQTVRLVTQQNLFHDRACRVGLGFPDDFCDKVEEDGKDPRRLEAIAYGNNLYIINVLISTIPASVFATFVGPWSDKYSRKYPLIVASSGLLVDSVMQALVAYIKTASPYWFLCGSVFTGFSGGILIVMSITYSYLSDVTDERSRQTRYAILEFFFIMAFPAGSYLGGKMYRHMGTVAVMAAAPCIIAVALLWIVFYVTETKTRSSDISQKQMLGDFFRLDRMKESFKTCTKKRPGNLRLQLWLLVAVSFSILLVNMGALTVEFPYVKAVFNWDVEGFSNVSTIFSLVNAFAILVVVPLLNRRLMVHEAAVGLIGIISLMAKMILMSVTVEEWVIYYALFSGCLFSCGGIAVRSRISKLVNIDELGKVFSLIATCESLSPVLGTVFMTQVFNASFKFLPGLAYAIAAFLLVPSACIFAWMMQLPTTSFIQEQEEEQKQVNEMKDIATTDVY